MALESRSVENVTFGKYDYDSYDTVQILTGDIVYVIENPTYPSTEGNLYRRVGGSYGGAGSLLNENYTALAFWENLGKYATTPSHNPILLDSSDSSAFKGLPFVGRASNNELVVGMFTEEMIWDFSADLPGDATSVSVSTSQTYNYGVLYKLNHVDFGDKNGLIIKPVATIGGISASALSAYYIDAEGNIYNNGTGAKLFTRWDGNGFGDNGEFNQLANGTLVDTNGNTVQTKVLYKRTGRFPE